MDIQNILLQGKSGEMSLETAEQMLEKIPYEDLGYAKLDHHRRIRSGFGEVVLSLIHILPVAAAGDSFF